VLKFYSRFFDKSVVEIVLLKTNSLQECFITLPPLL